MLLLQAKKIDSVAFTDMMKVFVQFSGLFRGSAIDEGHIHYRTGQCR